MTQIFVLRFKCAKCGEVWKVETSPPKTEPASCCPRCASFVREFAGVEEVRRSAAAGTFEGYREPSKQEIGGGSRGESSRPRNPLH